MFQRLFRKRRTEEITDTHMNLFEYNVVNVKYKPGTYRIVPSSEGTFFVQCLNSACRWDDIRRWSNGAMRLKLFNSKEAAKHFIDEEIRTQNAIKEKRKRDQ